MKYDSLAWAVMWLNLLSLTALTLFAQFCTCQYDMKIRDAGSRCGYLCTKPWQLLSHFQSLGWANQLILTASYLRCCIVLRVVSVLSSLYQEILKQPLFKNFEVCVILET